MLLLVVLVVVVWGVRCTSLPLCRNSSPVPASFHTPRRQRCGTEGGRRRRHRTTDARWALLTTPKRGRIHCLEWAILRRLRCGRRRHRPSRGGRRNAAAAVRRLLRGFLLNIPTLQRRLGAQTTTDMNLRLPPHSIRSCSSIVRRCLKCTPAHPTAITEPCCSSAGTAILPQPLRKAFPFPRRLRLPPPRLVESTCSSHTFRRQRVRRQAATPPLRRTLRRGRCHHTPAADDKTKGFCTPLVRRR